MRVKNIVIGIKSLESMLDDAQNVMEHLEKGEKVIKRKPGVYFADIETMRKAITPERIRILQVIKKESPGSIYELVKILDRDMKNVKVDVNYLSNLGLIELKKTKEGRERVTPSVNYDKLLLEIPI